MIPLESHFKQLITENVSAMVLPFRGNNGNNGAAFLEILKKKIYARFR